MCGGGEMAKKAGWAIAVHGGAGVDPALPSERQERAKRLLRRCLDLGSHALAAGASAIDVVEAVVRELETDPTFNSGRGSALTSEGTVEMEASIMDGQHRRCGAVSGLTTVKNPVSWPGSSWTAPLTRTSPLKGPNALPGCRGVETVDNEYFITEDNVGMLKLAKEADSILFDYRIPLAESCSKAALGIEPMNGLPLSVYAQETVGCVAVDALGRCAAATSTGGLMNKSPGRVGDSPIVGAGTYACELCAVSCTGEGEAILRATLARDVAALMEYKGLPLCEAVDYAIRVRLDEGKAGLIAVSSLGDVACGFNCTGMFRGYATSDGLLDVAIWD